MWYFKNLILPFADQLIEIAGYRIMARNSGKLRKLLSGFRSRRSFIDDLEAEEIICPTCREDSEEKLLSSGDLEKLRLARLLFEEMDVNMPGIEVILQMRQNMLDMRKQFDDILEDLASRLQGRFKREL